MRVELSPTGNLELNLGNGEIYIMSQERATRLANWIKELYDQDDIWHECVWCGQHYKTSQYICDSCVGRISAIVELWGDKNV